jgi:hypothetical protein
LQSYINPLAEWRDVVPYANKCVDRTCLDGVAHDMAQAPALIVIHTEVGTEAAAQARFENANDASHASAHYSVDLDGGIIQFVDEKDASYHAGNFAANMDSIGIEHEDNGDYNGPRTPELYASSARLVADIAKRYGIPLMRVTRADYEAGRSGVILHKEISDAPTACPDGLDVDRIIAQAKGAPAPVPAPKPVWNGTYPMPDPPPAGTTVDVAYAGAIMEQDGAGNAPRWFNGPDGTDIGPAPVGALVEVNRAGFDGVNWWDRITGPEGHYGDHAGNWWLLDSAIDGTNDAHSDGQTPVSAWNEAHKSIPLPTPPPHPAPTPPPSPAPTPQPMMTLDAMMAAVARVEAELGGYIQAVEGSAKNAESSALTIEAAVAAVAARFDQHFK